MQTTDDRWTSAVSTTFGRKAVETSRGARPGMPRVAIEVLQWLDKPATSAEITGVFALAPGLAEQVTSYLFEIGAVRGYGCRSRWRREAIWLETLTFHLLPELHEEFTREDLKEATGLLPGNLAGLLKLALKLGWLKAGQGGTLVRQPGISWSHLFPVRRRFVGATQIS
ncbi:hypothetical protein RQ734_22260 [Roseomonas mucosa]|nr:hypothetical protein [Roseomonas mucosa]